MIISDRALRFSVLIAVACFLVIYFWGEPIVGWLTGRS